MNEPNTIKIDDVEYIRADAAMPPPTVMTFGGKNPLPNAYAGRYVIIRSRNEGVNAGVLRAADETGCILGDARRLYYHRPVDRSLSWYEGVAISGVSEKSRLSPVVPTKIIVEDYSITLCTPDAEKSIRGAKSNVQS